MILKTGANAQISIHADSYHHTIVIKEPSFDFFIISSCRDWWIISEMGVKTNRSQQHPEREGPISVIGAIELHIHDRGTKRDWRKYAGRRGGRSHGSSRRGGKHAASASRRHRKRSTPARSRLPRGERRVRRRRTATKGRGAGRWSKNVRGRGAASSSGAEEGEERAEDLRDRGVRGVRRARRQVEQEVRRRHGEAVALLPC